MHPLQLFNLSSDPDEWVNLALDKANQPLVDELDALLKTKIDYPEVARDVARYNIQVSWFQVQ
jgi:hypothetical protein